MFNVEVFTVNAFAENTYLIYHDFAEAVLIDPGFSVPQEQNALLEFLEKRQVKIKDIWLTHCHIDHILGLKWAANLFNCTPKMHRTEQLVFDRAPMAAERWFIPYEAYEGGFSYLAPGQPLLFGNAQFEVLFVPGHAPGHLAFYHPSSSRLFSGDVLFENSIGRTDLPGGNHEALLQSIYNELLTLPENTCVYPGHGGTTTIGHEKKFNPFLTIN